MRCSVKEGIWARFVNRALLDAMLNRVMIAQIAVPEKYFAASLQSLLKLTLGFDL